MKPAILALETASERCSVALQHKGELYIESSEQPRGHADLILNMVNSVLLRADCELSELDALAYSKGPGAFTSIRIGTSVVQGLAMGTGLPVLTASSLEIMAHRFHEQEGSIVLPALDARMDEVYLGVYRVTSGRVIALQPDQVAAPEQVAIDLKPSEMSIIALGSGWQAYEKALQKRFSAYSITHDEEMFPDAEQLLKIATRDFLAGKTLSATEILPVYIRDKVTHGS